jgi:hypothetical protein
MANEFFDGASTGIPQHKHLIIEFAISTGNLNGMIQTQKGPKVDSQIMMLLMKEPMTIIGVWTPLPLPSPKNFPHILTQKP